MSKNYAKTFLRTTKLAGADAMFTPPELAATLRVNPSKVISWIKSGELRAANLATRTNGRARYRIAKADVEAFLARRSTQSIVPPPPRRKKSTNHHVIEYF